MDKQNIGLEIYLHANQADLDKLNQYEKLHEEQAKLKQSKKEKELEKSKKRLWRRIISTAEPMTQRLTATALSNY